MDCRFDPERIPAEFQGRPQFVNWKPVAGRKVPIRSNAPTRNAAVNDPRSWATFSDAVRVGQSCNVGLGFVFSESDEFAFVDLDWKLTGAPSPIQSQIIDRLSSFTEQSPSGLGAHVFVRADKSRIGRGLKADPLGVEIYLTGRYSTLTGQTDGYGQRDLAERTEALIDVIGAVSAVQIAEGGRNNALARQAGRLRHQGLTSKQITPQLSTFNQQACDPPLPEAEVRDIAGRVGEYDVSGFLALPRWLLHSKLYADLSPNAKSLLVDIGAGFTGANNGRLTATYEHMKCRGWKSPKVFYRAIAELLDAGLLVRTAKAGSHRPARYKIPSLNSTKAITTDYLHSSSQSEVYLPVYGSQGEV